MKELGIVFGNGFLGNRIADSLGFTVSPIRIQDYSSLRSYLEKEKPKVVINAIGKTKGSGAIGIDWCEKNKEQTFFSNVVVPGLLSLACYDLGIYFIQISTGGIYQGDNHGKGFSEEDEPNFIDTQFYAKTKADAERLVRNFPGLIIRIITPIDDSPHPSNLIDKLIKYPQIINLGGSATTVPHMIEALRKLINVKAEGIYNLTNPGIISPAEIMERYQDIVDKDHQFEVISSDELKKVTQVGRAICVLNTKKLESKGIKMPEIKKAVKECLIQYRRRLR